MLPSEQAGQQAAGRMTSEEEYEYYADPKNQTPQGPAHRRKKTVRLPNELTSQQAADLRPVASPSAATGR